MSKQNSIVCKASERIAPHPLFWVLIVLLALRLLQLINGDLALFYDEAYYHFWAQNPDWGYYSKPPMVAWIIIATTQFFGHTPEWAVKIGAALLYFATALVIYDLGRRLFDNCTGWYAALIFYSSPLVSFNSLFITTDAPLLLFWAITLWLAFIALQSQKLGWWILLGIAGGFGLLSKYTMGALAVAILLFLLSSKTHRQQLWQPGIWIAASTAALVFLPNILWNYQHDFISLQHTSEISHLDRGLFNPDKLLEFIAGQFFVFGPIAFWLFLRVLMKKPESANHRLLMFAAFAILGVISLQALLARAHVNWAAATYVSGSLLVAYVVVHHGLKHVFKWLLGINILLMTLFYFYQPILSAVGVEASKKNDPYHRVTGWREVTEKLTTLVPQPEKFVWVSESRKLLSYAHYYLSDFETTNGLEVRSFNPDEHISDQYELLWNLANSTKNAFIFIAEKPKDLRGCFGSIEDLGKVSHQTYATLERSIYVYRLHDFQGYENCYQRELNPR
ncbi:hypothetical protein THMIRHAS_00780 [Thiosulfatimonas sediminis]|uniref:Glycosyltransferase RgtA/B/C/D-like domain-containing protein n=1 Tax=Thiosulfatimonas sediminis TaxID=2675054 RepID=A0A6F8PRG3_9GAMM|nr:glycosyltransferase family 39 protein [Thiosulfatimonas sediminis]BBP44705.1 hypothetical protein THMIRHAS_00780 [Thiosulfatimonas sediminis]